jgi:hypothetical protein
VLQKYEITLLTRRLNFITGINYTHSALVLYSLPDNTIYIPSNPMYTSDRNIIQNLVNGWKKDSTVITIWIESHSNLEVLVEV